MNYFLIQPSADDSGQASWLLTGTANAALQHGTLDAAIEAAAGHPVILLAPAENVVLTTSELQIRQKAKLRKAIPYALEEQLAGDVDELHFALGPVETGRQTVAVIEHKLLRQWLEACNRHQVVPRAVVPDVLALPWQEGDWFVACDQQRALVRTGAASGYACDRGNLAILLQASLDSAAEPPANVHLWQCGDSGTLAWPHEQPRLLRHRCDGDLLQLLAESIDLNNAINLLQGDYSVQTDLVKSLKPWRWAAGLALLLFGLAYTGKVIERNQLASQQQALQQQAEQIYRQTFPDARKVVNPRVQMEQRLKQLRGGGESSEDRFLELLATSSKVLSANKDSRVESIRYRNKRLDLKISAASLSKLDSLKNQMMQAGLDTELTNADSAQGKAVGNLRIKQR